MNLSTKFFLFLIIFISSNFVFSQTRNALIIGDIEGHVYNGDGLTIAGASIGVDGWGQTTSDATGYYLLTGLPEGDNDVVCYKEGYNTVTDVVVVPSGGVVTHDFTLTQPNLTISPLFFDEILNPNEYLTTSLGILNIGDGDGGWTAVINYPSKGTSSNAINVTGQPYPVLKNTGSEKQELAENGDEPMYPSDATRDLFECNAGSLFGNSPVGSTNASWSQYGGPYQQYQQVNGIAETWTTVTFWGVFTSGTPVTEDFFIGIYDDNGSTYGSEIASYILPLDPISTGEILLGTYPIYQWIAVIDEQVTTDFWISCQATSQMYWLQSPTGTGNSTAPYPLAVCIEGDPTANWLTLDEYEGAVPANGGSQNIGVNFDASGTVEGEVYTAEIVITTDPDVGTFNIPVTMTIFGDPLCEVTNLEIELINPITGWFTLTWIFDTTACPGTFQYFLIKRDGIAIGTTTDTSFSSWLFDYGTICYTVTAIFDEGNGGDGASTCIDWYVPELCWSPTTMYNEQWIDHQEEVTLTIESCGPGTLQFMFPDYISSSRFACDMQVALYDSYGDGWNGGSLDVFVNGNLVLDDITLDNGSGPEFFTFSVESGDDISTIYTAGQWSYENSYEFYDGDGNLIYTSANVSVPAGVVFGTCPQPSYIIDVEPATGIIPSGETMDITITYDATGFPLGLYDEWLKIETNDPLYQEDSILNQMLVYSPAQYYGTVTDCNTSLPVTAVAVTAGEYVTETNSNGYYELYVDEDIYDVVFSLLGYDPVIVEDTFALAGEMTEVSICITETSFSVSSVYADPNEADTECLVTWDVPSECYEIIYDDGEADDYAIWTAPGGVVGVGFTPAGYPATIIGARLYVGDGSFPAGGNFLGFDCGIGIMDDDGVNGLPGTILDSVTYTVSNFGWIDLYDMFNTIIEDGDFYIVMWQLGFAANSAPIGIDTDVPTVYRSVVKPPGSGWTVSPYQDFMIRAYVCSSNTGFTSSSIGTTVHLPRVTEGPFLATSMPKGISGTVKDGSLKPIESSEITRNLTNYIVARVSDFDPDMGPETGTLTTVANPTNTSYNATGFGNQPEGFYAYAVQAEYESGVSEWEYSNTVAHLLDNEFTIEVTLCDGNEPDSANVILIGHDYPYQVLNGITNIDGISVFDSVIDGTYDLFVTKVGYSQYEHLNLAVLDNMIYSLTLEEKPYPPRNLYVETSTNTAYWDEPLITQLYLETFTDSIFPPEDWQTSTLDRGWYRSDHSWCSDWPIPPGDGFYALANDCGSSVSSEDYLITPLMDLRESEDFTLYFSSFYTGQWLFSAYIEYSYDNGDNWNVLETISPYAVWEDIEIDLSGLSGPSSQPVWLAFHGDDNGIWSSGWAVDNIEIRNGPSPTLGYYIFLNDALVAQNAADDLDYTFVDLAYGETYTACIRALYACGLSDSICETWVSTFLYPPRNLTDEYIFGTDDVPLKWNPPMTGSTSMAAAFNIVYVGPQLKTIDVSVDAAREVTIIEFEESNISRDFGDLQFTFPNADATGEAGCETDGEFIYTTLWNGSNFFKYDIDGNLLETFVIPGVSNVRDMAYDGEFFYGAAANTTVFVMDFSTHTLVTTFTAPIAVRAIAYNEDDETFYANNWGTDIVNFDVAGNNLGSFMPSVTSIYGLAYDKWSEPGNQYLWAYDQGANNLIQFDLPAGTPTGVTFDVPVITGSNELAGGLFTEPSLFEFDETTIGGNAQNDIVWGIEIAQYTGGGGVIPDGLISYNLYQDGVNIANIPYEGQGVDDWVDIVIMNLMPATYLFDVSAVYDLTPYGYPGDFGESAWHGADTVDVAWGFELPFYEGWDNGTFTFQDWYFNDYSENWVINYQTGDPEPSAEFTWDPLLEDGYSSTLTSNPINAYMLTEGDIFLSFDIKLDDRNSNGKEKISVEVYNGNSWNQVAEFANNGSFDFDTNHINITDFAMSRVFQVRFNATGQNSFDIISWFVDNISISRECEAPFDLTGYDLWDPELQQWVAEICWESPFVPGPLSEWIHWDSGETGSAIGLTDGGTFSVAARWDAGQLVDYTGTSITKIRYVPLEGFTSIVLKVWIGADAGSLIYEEDVTSTAVVGEWNEVTLTAPIPLDVNDELWVGYTITHTAGTFPAGTDAGPAISGYGDMITTDGSTWNPLSGFGLDYNWNVQFFVTEISSSIPVPMIDKAVYNTSSSLLENGEISNKQVIKVNSDSRDITSFNIYRMTDGATEYELYDVENCVAGQTSYCYTDTDVVIYSGAYYKVTANYISETDACESAPAMAYELPMDDFVYILFEGIEDLNTLTTNVYPNPAKDMLTVTSSIPIKQLTIINYVGQDVFERKINKATSIELNTSSFKSGAYIVKIDTENGIVTRRFIISR